MAPLAHNEDSELFSLITIRCRAEDEEKKKKQSRTTRSSNTSVMSVYSILTAVIGEPAIGL